MRLNMVGAFIRNAPFGTEIAFAKGFQRLGNHSVTTIDPDHPSAFDTHCDATVVFKWLEGPCLEEFKKLPGKKIVYQPDDLRFPHIRHMMSEMRKYCDYSFCFDDDGVRLAKEYGYRDAQKLLLTADDELYRPRPEFTRDLDFVFVGSLAGGPNHAGRSKMLQTLANANFRVAAAMVFDVEKITEYYARAKVVLNHATDVGQPFGSGYGYQCRHFEAGMSRTCLLSNRVVNDRALVNFVEFWDEKSLLDQAQALMEDLPRRLITANDLFEEIRKDHLPEHRAAQMVEFIEGLS